jgi:hypothetical protein
MSGEPAPRANDSPPRDFRDPIARRPAPRLLRTWIAPVLAMAVVAFLVFLAFYALDVILLGGDAPSLAGLLQRYLTFDPGMITDALPALGMTIVAALGIVLTVVAIIVQLSSDRYTGVAMMFLRDPVNIAVMSFYVIASLCAVWLSVSLHEDFVPRACCCWSWCSPASGWPPCCRISPTCSGSSSRATSSTGCAPTPRG